ncbi:rod shape-determining protein MreC, partial [candidate division WWE3 bacterium]|nr:rod shape-determining protein MreC [candidate division WWE3 bacterium]
QLALKASGELDKELLLADVLGNPLDQTGQTIIVNKGFSHGVTEGSNVVLKNNLVGVVTSVSRGRSVVSLVTSPNTRSTVVDIDSPDRLEGVARGDFGISIIMSQILPNELISVNDLIVTSGKDGLFEPNLILGKVVEIQGTESDPIRSAVIKSELDLKRLEKVFIIIL